LVKRQNYKGFSVFPLQAIFISGTGWLNMGSTGLLRSAFLAKTNKPCKWMPALYLKIQNGFAGFPEISRLLLQFPVAFFIFPPLKIAYDQPACQPDQQPEDRKNG
jgi:hypothetical protein